MTGSKQWQVLALTEHEIEEVEMLRENLAIALVLDCAVVASLYSSCTTLGSTCKLLLASFLRIGSPPGNFQAKQQ